MSSSIYRFLYFSLSVPASETGLTSAVVSNRVCLTPKNRLGLHKVFEGSAGFLPFPVIDPLNKGMIASLHFRDGGTIDLNRLSRPGRWGGIFLQNEDKLFTPPSAHLHLQRPDAARNDHPVAIITVPAPQRGRLR
jgi:hypothetical protein